MRSAILAALLVLAPLSTGCLVVPIDPCPEGDCFPLGSAALSELLSGPDAFDVLSYAEDFEFVLSRLERLFARSKDIEDLNLRGAYLHVLADALISVFVILALLLGAAFGGGFAYLDPLVGIVGGVVIARWALGLVRDSSRELLGLERA